MMSDETIIEVTRRICDCVYWTVAIYSALGLIGILSTKGK